MGFFYDYYMYITMDVRWIYGSGFWEAAKTLLHKMTYPVFLLLLLLLEVTFCLSVQPTTCSGKDHSSLSLQARYDVRFNPELILSVQGRTNPERILNHNRTVAEPILLIRSASVRSWFWFVRPPFSHGSHTYVCICSHFGSAEPILSQKCLQGCEQQVGPKRNT